MDDILEEELASILRERMSVRRRSIELEKENKDLRNLIVCILRTIGDRVSIPMSILENTKEYVMMAYRDEKNMTENICIRRKENENNTQKDLIEKLET